MQNLSFLAAVIVSVLPSFVKVPLYRLIYRFKIGKRAKIGFGVVFFGIKRCRIGDDVRIRHLNLFLHVEDLHIGSRTRIGYLNLFRGGERIEIGPCTTVMRLNVFNSILEPNAVGRPKPVLSLGAGVVVTTSHWFDFTDRLTIGANTVVGGRNSSFWTHSRQKTQAVTIGAHCYLGSELRVAPGVGLASFCVVALGAVLTGQYTHPHSLIGGNPAVVKRSLNERDRFFVDGRTTRFSGVTRKAIPAASSRTERICVSDHE